MGQTVFPAPVVSTTDTWVLVGTQTASSSATLTFTGLSGSLIGYNGIPYLSYYCPTCWFDPCCWIHHFVPDPGEHECFVWWEAGSGRWDVNLGVYGFLGSGDSCARDGEYLSGSSDPASPTFGATAQVNTI